MAQKASKAKHVKKKASAPAPKKSASKQAAKSKPVHVKPPKAIVKEVVAEEETFTLKKVFTKPQLKEYRQILDKLRDRVVDEISFLAGDNLNRSQRESSGDLSSYSFHMADQGTDNFDREFALNLVSSEQDVLYEIDDAIRRTEMGNYGVCESCGKAIEKARLRALPFAKMCIACKSASEKGKSRFRPFGPTLSQATSSESNN